MKSPYRTKESETYHYNFKETNSDARSINIGSDIINAAGLLSNGANSNRNYSKNAFNINTPFKNTTTESEEKTKIVLKDIVSKNIFNKIYKFKL